MNAEQWRLVSASPLPWSPADWALLFVVVWIWHVCHPGEQFGADRPCADRLLV